MTKEIIITDFNPEHESGIADLLDGIQAEYAASIYPRSAPKVVVPMKLWVALSGGFVVGTVGVAAISNNNVMLKSMMVQKEFRGKAVGLSNRLLDTALTYAGGVGAQRMYLGTMTQFKAARVFYINHGFTEITRDQLPADFVCNPVDDVFFYLQLNQ